jgi:AraC-like DNA-binding protein
VIKTITPNSPILKKHIECFYIYDGKSSSKHTYVAFPHYNTGLSFFKGVTINRRQRSLEISESGTNSIHIEILGKYTRPVLLEYNGLIREISIVFKPLGINRFISDNYHSVAPNFSQEFTNSVWRHFTEDLFSGEDDLSKVESFLLSQFSENQDLLAIEESLKLLEKGNEQTAISAISTKVGLTLKTFQRHFNKHMGCSPIEYRRICRFRNSLTSKLNSSELKNLTDITYGEGYYDQSYFIKEFRKLTNHNPKDFFKSASKVDGDKIVWELK